MEKFIFFIQKLFNCEKIVYNHIMREKILKEKIIYLNKMLVELSELSNIKEVDFYKSKRDISATENYLRKAIQIIIDLADDMVAKNRLGPCSSYYEIFEVLSNNDRLSGKNIPIYMNMVKLRNKIIYEYENVTKEELYKILQENLGDFDIAIEDIKRNLKK